MLDSVISGLIREAAHAGIFMNRFTKFLAANFLLAATFTAARAMEVIKFDEMNSADKGDYIQLMADAAEKLLEKEGRTDQARKVYELFNVKAPGADQSLGLAEFNSNVWASRQLSSAARHGFSVWIVMADLDLFKKVNDTFGHDAGDTVLKSFATIIATNTRQSNICARLGGEEFLLIMTHTNKEDAKTAVERIRKQFEGTKFTFGNSTTSVTASFGIVGFCGSQPPELNALVSRADAALYSANRNGRNKVAFDDNV